MPFRHGRSITTLTPPRSSPWKLSRSREAKFWNTHPQRQRLLLEEHLKSVISQGAYRSLESDENSMLETTW